MSLYSSSGFLRKYDISSGSSSGNRVLVQHSVGRAHDPTWCQKFFDLNSQALQAISIAGLSRSFCFAQGLKPVGQALARHLMNRNLLIRSFFVTALSSCNRAHPRVAAHVAALLGHKNCRRAVVISRVTLIIPGKPRGTWFGSRCQRIILPDRSSQLQAQ